MSRSTLLKRRHPPLAFTLVEALLAITIMSLAASVLLLGTSSSLQTTNTGLYGTIAQGMAQQLMDEIVGNLYCDTNADPYQNTLGPGADEPLRKLYDDIDDYNGLRSQPPKDLYGIALGKDDGVGGQRNPQFQSAVSFINNWKQEVDVYYLNATDLKTKLSTGQTSDYRMVEVRITYKDPTLGDRVYANLKRVVPYVPVMQ
jgi:type II secretory pathway pseudopilin PulG